MVRTYWAVKEDGRREFLGAFAFGHKADPSQPQFHAFILDVQDVAGPQKFLDRLAGRVMLDPLPAVLTARNPTTCTWKQFEGYVK